MLGEGLIAIGFFRGVLTAWVVGVNAGAGYILTGKFAYFWYLMRKVFHSVTFDSASSD